MKKLQLAHIIKYTNVYINYATVSVNKRFTIVPAVKTYQQYFHSPRGDDEVQERFFKICRFSSSWQSSVGYSTSCTVCRSLLTKEEMRGKRSQCRRVDRWRWSGMWGLSVWARLLLITHTTQIAWPTLCFPFATTRNNTQLVINRPYTPY